jgi:CheY-like chemotaxis protein
VDGGRARPLTRSSSPAPLPLVALTGHGAAEDARARDAGFDVHLVKPVDAAGRRALLAG